MHGRFVKTHDSIRPSRTRAPNHQADCFSATKLRSACLFPALLFSFLILPLFLFIWPVGNAFQAPALSNHTISSSNSRVDRPCRRTLFTFHLPRFGRPKRDFFYRSSPPFRCHFYDSIAIYRTIMYFVFFTRNTREIA